MALSLSHLVLVQEDGPTPQTFRMLESTLINTSLPQNLVEDTVITPGSAWLFGSWDNSFVAGSSRAAAPAMLLQPSGTLAVGRIQLDVIPSLALKANEPGVTAVGDGWLVGVKQGSLVINTVVEQTGKWPQFVLEESGVLHVLALSTSAGPAWSRNITTAAGFVSWAWQDARAYCVVIPSSVVASLQVAIADWLVAMADGSHLVVVPNYAAAQGLKPALLIR